VALKGDAAAEKSKDQLSRDFPGRSIFEFCNNIGPLQTCRARRAMSALGGRAEAPGRAANAAYDPTQKSGAFRLHWPPTRRNRLALLLGAAVGQADVLKVDSLLGCDWNNLGDFEKLGIAKAEQEADARVIRKPL
jgi:hypothetical protein